MLHTLISEIAFALESFLLDAEARCTGLPRFAITASS